MKSDTDHASRQENPFRKVFKLYHKSLLSVFMGPPKYFPDSSVGKESTCNAGDLGLIPGLQRSPGESNCYPLQYSGLENPMDCIVLGVTKSLLSLSLFTHYRI